MVRETERDGEGEGVTVKSTSTATHAQFAIFAARTSTEDTSSPPKYLQSLLAEHHHIGQEKCPHTHLFVTIYTLRSEWPARELHEEEGMPHSDH